MILNILSIPLYSYLVLDILQFMLDILHFYN